MSEHMNTSERKKRPYWLLIILFLFIVFYFIFGFITIQPIGAIPDGITLLVVRAGTQLRFFDSPDALCERIMGGVSLLCRGMAIGSIGENSTIILRLPYIDAFYLASTGGNSYNK
jgi:hypothetical protein